MKKFASKKWEKKESVQFGVILALIGYMSAVFAQYDAILNRWSDRCVNNSHLGKDEKVDVLINQPIRYE